MKAILYGIGSLSPTKLHVLNKPCKAAPEANCRTTNPQINRQNKEVR
jgi:hypothetical protein